MTGQRVRLRAAIGEALRIPDIERPDAAVFYGDAIVLSRPDQHVAWRGDRLPADPLALIDHIRCAANPVRTANPGVRQR